MMGLAAFTILYFVYVGIVHGTSIPIFCQDMQCVEGTTCLVVEPAECTPRFCPPPHGECVPISSKDGVCPNRLENPRCLSFRGVAMCLTDNDCQDDMKCCGGCCKTPDANLPTDGVPPYEGTPGMCPVEENLDILRLWTGLHCPQTDIVDECFTDAECPVMHKCCTTLCGNRCRRARAVMAPMPTEDTTVPPA